MDYKPKNRLSPSAYTEGILGGDKVILSKAITLVESSLPEDNRLARKVLEKVLPHTGNSLRIGITGVPGVGKSTFIESLGMMITAENTKLAVLAIDPSSQRSKGSIMGDKTRMEDLAHHPLAYIRPSATGSTLGGVSHKTREVMLLCEAAGHQIILIETVGVGQSEIAVHGMVDFFLLLMLAGAGDELQGIKKGIMEMADAIAIVKADGENMQAALQAKGAYQNALHLFQPSGTGWVPQVVTCSALEKNGLKEIWALIQQHHRHMQSSGLFQPNRDGQNLQWMHESIKQSLLSDFYENPRIARTLKVIEENVVKGKIAPINAAHQLLASYHEKETLPGSGSASKI